MDYQRLDKNALAGAARAVGRRDPRLGVLVRRNGTPPLWARRPGFATLVHIILEQQVSLASAAAAYDKMKAALDRVTPGSFLTLTDARLRRCGFSRQKTRYCRVLAQNIVDKTLRLADIHRAGAGDAHTLLTAQPGIGNWTADIYLLMALRHPDIWPRGDIALDTQLASLKPGARHVNRDMHHCRPWRSVAARILWHDYLLERGRPV